ncbi:serine protease 30 [Exaiptasia diaphana]|uniref:Peptidase S1 domain-containing protein n=1 Tax=Exaiptasia diaphana TaxID=2652724 RepID=A0A913Y065_EXADI|nr:serine protease 30 [Exaiptasia diaphana]
MMLLIPLLLLGALCTCFAEAKKIECGTIGKGIGRIVGGKSVTTKGAWPWQISIKSRRGFRHFCGGSIIKPNWIVTAAHCFHPNPNPSHYKVTAGQLNFRKKERDVQTLDIEKIIRHPNFNQKKSPKFDYDIALLKLKNKITYNDKVRPICLPRKRFPDGENCYATGWGRLKEKKKNESPKTPNILQQLKIPLVSDKTCRRRFRLMSSRMICGGYREKGKGVCQGDSGGPLACKNKSGIWDLAGVVSFGWGCARKDTYDFYTNMVKLKGWVERQINRNYLVQVPLISMKDCKEAYNKKNIHNILLPITSRMLCAGSLKGGKNTCHGDSGGPLSCKTESGIWELVGAVSWAQGCARKGIPTVYADMENLKDWVQTTIQ